MHREFGAGNAGSVRTPNMHCVVELRCGVQGCIGYRLYSVALGCWDFGSHTFSKPTGLPAVMGFIFNILSNKSFLSYATLQVSWGDAVLSVGELTERAQLGGIR